jgi:hypothetical protein
MTRGRSTAPRSSSPFTFPIQLPVLHPPRLLKRQPPSTLKVETHKPAITLDSMAPVRNRRRRSTVTLPDVENSDAAPQLRSKRKTSANPLPLSPRALNIELAGRSAASSEKAATFQKWNEEGYQSFGRPAEDGECMLWLQFTFSSEFPTSPISYITSHGCFDRAADC